MKPLQWVAVGYVLTALYARVHGFDLLADPLGWLLVLRGTRALPDGFGRPTLQWVGGAALAVSLPLWVPAVVSALDDADPSLSWALSLPALAYVALLCHQLDGAARTARERLAPHVFRGLVTVTLVVAVLPVLVFGGHLDGLDTTASTVSGLLPVVLFVVLLNYAGRPWAGATIAETPTRSSTGS